MKLTLRKRDECPHCFGTKRVPVARLGRGGGLKSMKCRGCNGKGWLPRR